jgi:hypothetical protein
MGWSLVAVHHVHAVAEVAPLHAGLQEMAQGEAGSDANTGCAPA